MLDCYGFFLVVYLGFFGSTGDCTQPSHMLVSHCTIWAMPPAIFAFIIFQIGSQAFAQHWPQTPSCYFCLPCSWDDGMHHHGQLTFWDGVFTNFLHWLASDHDPPSASWVAGFPGVWATIPALLWIFFAPLCAVLVKRFAGPTTSYHECPWGHTDFGFLLWWYPGLYQCGTPA
jgi:hypothetical protein